MTRAINTWTVAAIRYPAGIHHLTKEKMRNMDRKSRKMMTMNEVLYPRADVSRLHLPRDKGGKGLTLIGEKWRILTSASAYCNTTNRCNLCIQKFFYIFYKPLLASLKTFFPAANI